MSGPDHEKSEQIDFLPTEIASLLHGADDETAGRADQTFLESDQAVLDLLSTLMLDPKSADYETRIAEAAKFIVADAAYPSPPGEPVKATLARATKNLRLDGESSGFWRVRKAWEGKAGPWKGATFLEFVTLWISMRGRRRRKARKELAALFSQMKAMQSRERKTNAAHQRPRGVCPDRLIDLLRAAGLVRGALAAPDC